MPVEKTVYGQTPQGQTVELFTIINSGGLCARVSSHGARLVSMETPDRDGNLKDITLGFDTLDEWLGEKKCYFGCTVGRCAGRINKAKFTLDGKLYTLASNDGENHLHGGTVGFDRKIWNAETIPEENAVKFSYLSGDGEEQYPGNLDVCVVYTLTDDNELKIDYTATTDQPTVVNLTNHAYWNLAGDGDVLNHELMINSDGVTEMGDDLTVNGEILPVADTPLDFTVSKTVGKDIKQMANGYDHNFCLRGDVGKMKIAAVVFEPVSGRVMEISTTEPGVVFYTGNFLDGSVTGKGGKVYSKHYALCLETQHYPDSINQPKFPSTVLKPGETYRHTTVHKFSIK